MSTIVVATDLSRVSTRAVEVGLDLARRLSARLLLVNVLDLGRLSGRGRHDRVDQARAEREPVLLAMVRDARAAGDDYRSLIRSSPRDAKVRLAREVISWLHSPAAAEEAEAAFRRQFVEKQVPADMPEVSVGAGPHRLAALLVKAGLATSNGEANRKIKEGAVDVDQQRVIEFQKEYLLDKPLTVRLGRKYARLVP